MPHPSLIIFIPLYFSFFFIIKSNGNNDPSLLEYCAPSKCGDLEVKYPFWIQTNNTSTQYEYCGYKYFGLICLTSSTSNADNDLLLLDLPTDSLYVKSIDYANQRVTLVDIDVTTNQTCPRPRQNLNLEDIFWDYIPDLPSLRYSVQDSNLTFYFNCSQSLPSNTSTYALDCLRSGRNTSYVSLETNNGFAWFEVCEEKVVAPVSKGETSNNWVSSLGRVMNEGFVVDWRRDRACAKCELSQGLCGYHSNSLKLLCFCGDGTITNGQCEAQLQPPSYQPTPQDSLSPPISLPPQLLGPQVVAAPPMLPPKRKKPSKKVIIGAVVGGLGLLTCLLVCYLKFKKLSDLYTFILGRKTNEDRNLHALIMQHRSLAPKRYPYSDIKKMTNSFQDKLGQGGYGAVYKGKLLDGRLVAVKILNVAKGNGEEFINEVLSISKTSHVNVVTLLGFCLEGKRRALVYEFMPNGSLEKYIHSKENCNQLGMDKLYQISLGVARGLEYLHRGCNIRILHFDIKPHNILLDEEFCPKISDFGLAKECAKNDSTISMQGARGTIGYIAPELTSRNFGRISYKSDVYSYGMMVMEIVGRRKNVNIEISHTSEIYFPHWAYQHLVIDKDLSLKGVESMEEDEIAKKIILVGLWCIQSDPSQRPTMSKVIEMLEGSLQALEIPPKPFFGSPSRSPQTSSVTIAMVS